MIQYLIDLSVVFMAYSFSLMMTHKVVFLYLIEVDLLSWIFLIVL